jgi:hypothetical protein
MYTWPLLDIFFLVLKRQETFVENDYSKLIDSPRRSGQGKNNEFNY